MAGVMSGKKMFCLIFLCSVIVGSFVFQAISLRFQEKSSENITQTIQQEKSDADILKRKIAKIESRIAVIKNYQDIVGLQDQLSEIDGGDSTSDHFLRMESLLVDRVSGFVEVGNYKQMENFIRASRYKSTNNLLIIAFFENEKLSNSKKDIIFATSLLGRCEREELFGDLFNRKKVQKFLLDKVIESPEPFSTMELLNLFRTISLKDEMVADFLDQYIGEIRKTKL